MQVPSRLKEYPAGTMSPTVGRAHPTCSILAISPGKAVSEEEVPTTRRSSSLMSRRILRRLKPARCAMAPSTTKMKTAQVR